MDDDDSEATLEMTLDEERMALEETEDGAMDEGSADDTAEDTSDETVDETEDKAEDTADEPTDDNTEEGVADSVDVVVLEGFVQVNE